MQGSWLLLLLLALRLQLCLGVIPGNGLSQALLLLPLPLAGSQTDPVTTHPLASGGGESSLLESKGSGGPEHSQEAAAHSDSSQEPHPLPGGR